MHSSSTNLATIFNVFFARSLTRSRTCTIQQRIRGYFGMEAHGNGDLGRHFAERNAEITTQVQKYKGIKRAIDQRIFSPAC
jgi:hypothetical protein